MAAAFFDRDGDRFVPSELTRGPWDPDSQHAGPPAALLGRAIEAREPSAERQVGRITVEILRPVPLAPLTLATRVLRPGRSVELLEAELSGADGVLMRATAWRVGTAAVELPPSPAESRPPGPERGAERPFFPTGAQVGYHTAVEFRFVEGGFVDRGPAKAWLRMRHPLVAGEEPTPLQRLLVAADSGNGVSAALDYRRYLFINTDLSVHIRRMPVGEWVCLDAVTYPEPNGVGMTDTSLWDERGWIGRAAQTLLVRRR
jgi:Thioesterase-like superfamily